MTSDPPATHSARIGAQDAAGERVRPLAVFARNCTALWATTYGLDPTLVNEFLLAQLGEPPLNLTVLADATCLADTLQRIRDVASLAAVNRRWLLRGIRHGHGAFHPKSYLAVTPTQTTLLIGSGNLNADGLGEGNEVFTEFTTGTPHGDAAVSVWLQWARRLVADTDDLRLAERFTDLNQRLPKLPGASDSAPADHSSVTVLHNLDQALLPQLLEQVQPARRRVEELLITAPFYDADVAAVGALVDGLAPSRVQVWAAAETNVDGPALLQRLGGTGAEVVLWRYTPDRFVHAKLVGVVTGDRGWLLSGSANISRAALTLTPTGGGNVELAVLTHLPRERLLAAFMPPGTSAEPWPPEQHHELQFSADPEPDPLPVRLHAVEGMNNSPLARLRTTPEPYSVWLLTDGTRREPLDTTSAEEASVYWPDGGRLVWLCDADGETLSNRVVVDDPSALSAALRTRGDAKTHQHPSELQASDLATPLGQLLERFHRNLIMDASELTERSAAVDATEEESQAGDTDELWERLQHEQLVRDPRVGLYRGLRAQSSSSSDFLLELLEMLRDRVPGGNEPVSSPFRATVAYLNEVAERWHEEHRAGEDDATSDERPRRRWSMATRVRVRARNVLRRWADAQSEPQLAWIDPLAPLKNLQGATHLLAGLYHLRRQDGEQPGRPPACPLTEDDLADLSYRWIAAVVGSGEGDGWLQAVDDATRSSAERWRDESLAGACAALAWKALGSGSGHRQRLIRWQPVVRRATDSGLMTANTYSTEVAEHITGTTVTPEHIARRLHHCRDFIDDDLWCDQTASSLGLTQLSLGEPPAGVATSFGATLHVDGISDPLVDPRTLRLIAAVRAYRRMPGVALRATDDTWRLAVPRDGPATYMAARGSPMLSSKLPIDDDVVTLLLDEAGVLASYFSEDEVA